MDNASAVTDQFSTRNIHLNISALNAMSLIFWQNKKKKYFSFRESQITRNIHLCMMIKISRESSSALVNLNSGRHEFPLENSVTIFYWIFLWLNHYNSNQPDEHSSPFQSWISFSAPPLQWSWLEIRDAGIVGSPCFLLPEVHPGLEVWDASQLHQASYHILLVVAADVFLDLALALVWAGLAPQFLWFLLPSLLLLLQPQPSPPHPRLLLLHPPGHRLPHRAHHPPVPRRVVLNASWAQVVVSRNCPLVSSQAVVPDEQENMSALQSLESDRIALQVGSIKKVN